MKQHKIIVLIVALFVIIGAVTVVCVATDVFDRRNHETWYGSAKDGGIDDELADQIKVGMSFEEAVAILGKPQRDTGSGVWIMEWDMKSGKILAVAFNSVPDDAYDESDLHFDRTLISIYIEIKSK